MKNYYNEIRGFLQNLQLEIIQENEQEGIFIVNNESEGILHLIICVAQPIVIFEQFIFEIKEEADYIYKSLLQKNRDIIHGAFVLDSTGKRVIFRDSLQVESLNQNEFEATINSLSVLLSEYSEQIINYSKNN